WRPAMHLRGDGNVIAQPRGKDPKPITQAREFAAEMAADEARRSGNEYETAAVPRHGYCLRTRALRNPFQRCFREDGAQKPERRPKTPWRTSPKPRGPCLSGHSLAPERDTSRGA